MNQLLLILPLAFLLLLSVPQSGVDAIRSAMTTVAKPLWRLGHRLPFSHGASESNSLRELQELRLENYQLKSQLDLAYEWVNSEKRIQDLAEQVRALDQEPATDVLRRRSAEMRRILQSQAIAALARVLYRDPSAWSSTCWIDVGEENNGALGRQIVAKHSPVVLGNALIGVVEYVGKRQSRVRLITDSGLKIAVRAVRGSILERDAALAIQTAARSLRKLPDFKQSPDLTLIESIQQKLPYKFEDGYFAKGELSGSSAAYYRSLHPLLQGIGFNCDFADAERGALDLRNPQLLREGDLLITSGLDGVFPPGLAVARVTSVSPLIEGAYTYELQAEPVAGNLGDFRSVAVLPPVGMD
jgi:cell shape-determining protein MreC